MQRFRRRKINVVAIGVARGRGRELAGLIVDALEDDRHLVRREQAGKLPRVTTSSDNDFVGVGRGPLHGGFDLALVISVDHERQIAAHIKPHGFPRGHKVLRRQSVLAAGLAGPGISAGFLEKILECPDLFAPLLRLVRE